MRTIQKFKIALSIVLVALLGVSCLPEQESMGDAGQTLIKFTPGDFALVALDAKTTSQTADMFIVRKDAHSEAALNTATTVILQKNDALLTAYNTANETEFIPLPTSLATTSPAPAADGKITIQFAPGEHAKNIVVSVPNASNFDFSKQYALGYKMTTVSGIGAISQAVSDEIVVQVLVKNKYHGNYKATGYFTHPSSPRAIDMDKFMSTSGATSISGGYADLGGSGYFYNITVDENSNLTVPGVSKRCYKVTMTNGPVAFLYYDTTENGTMKNYCFEHAPGKWTFVLFSGYSSGTRKSEETLVMY